MGLFGFRVYSLGFRASGLLRFRRVGLSLFRASGVQGVGLPLFRVEGLQGLGFRAQGSEVRGVGLSLFRVRGFWSSRFSGRSFGLASSDLVAKYRVQFRLFV